DSAEHSTLSAWNGRAIEQLTYLRHVCLSDNTTILQLPIVRDKGLLGDIAIHVIAKPNFLLHISNQATENEDYILQERIIAMKESIKETYVKVAILPDNAPELEEGFIVNITEVYLMNSDFSVGQPSVQRPGMEIAEIMIEENDDPRGIFKFHINRDVGGVITAYEVPPPLNVLQVPVVRLAGSFGAVHVYWEATLDSAGLEDFKPSHGILEFADKQATAMIEITIIDDAEFELMEMFNISLVRVAGGGRLGDDVGIMVGESLVSDDPDPHVTLTVVRSPGGKGAVGLQWVIDEAAQGDLSPLNGTLHFDEALNDDIPEEKSFYEFQLTGVGKGAMLSESSTSASITVAASDLPYGRFAFSHEHLPVSEAAQRVDVTVFRSGGSLGPVGLWYETVSGTAEAGLDFVSAAGELLFEAGE
ncbi:hypothetical protein MC885_010870, partial [Smutsia gigantea]